MLACQKNPKENQCLKAIQFAENTFEFNNNGAQLSLADGCAHPPNESRGVRALQQAGHAEPQIARPSTLSVSALTNSGIFSRCGSISSARRNASSARLSSPISW